MALSEKDRLKPRSHKTLRQVARSVLRQFRGDVEPPTLPRAAFNDRKRARGSGERQWDTFSPDRKSKWKAAQRQYVVSDKGLELVSEEETDNLKALSNNEIQRRFAICADCIKANNGILNEDNCAICASDGILATMLLQDDWAIDAARSISLESLQLRKR